MPFFMLVKHDLFHKVGTQPIVFENEILRRIFGLKRNENGEWRKFHEEGFPSKYRSPNIVTLLN